MRNIPKILAGVLFVIGSVARADVIPFATSSVIACISRVNTCDVGFAGQTASNGTVSIDQTLGSAALQAQFTANLSATSTYGDLRASSSNTFDNSGAPSTIQMTSEATVEDILTINFPPFTGDKGFLQIDYTLDGNISSAGPDNAFSEVSIAVGPANGSLDQGASSTYMSSVSGTFQGPQVTFIYGQPLALYLDLLVGTGTVIPNGGGFGAGTPVGGTGSATADFYNTLLLSGLTVFDPTDQHIVSDAQFLSASGTPYGPSGIVPEPHTIGILGVALLVFFVVRFRDNHPRYARREQ